MRRILFLAAALSLVMAACGGGSEDKSSGVSTGPVEIQIWHSETASAADNLVKLVNEFNAAQSEVKVDAVYQGNDAELTLKVIAGLPSNVPAVAYMSEPFTQTLIDSGQIVPAQQYIDKEKYDLSDFAPASLAYYTINGELYAMPFGLAVPLMYYNKIPFRQAGLDPEKPPRDLDEARRVSEKLQQRDAGGNVTQYGFSMNIEPWVVEVVLAGADQYYVNNDNGRQARATETAFDNDAGKAFFRWWKDMYDGGLLTNTGRSTTGADNLLAIGARRAVMTYSTSAALRSIYDVLETMAGEDIEIGVAPVPGVPGAVPEGSPGVYSRSLWIMKGRPKAEQDAAWKLIRWLDEPAQQAEWFAGSGYLPVRNSAYGYQASKDIIAKYPAFQLPVDLFARTATTTAALGPLLGPFQQVRDGMSDALEGMLAGNLTADQALEQAAAKGNDAIKEYNRRLGQ